MTEHDTHTVDDPTRAEFRPIEEEYDKTHDRLIDWLCWHVATTGDRFYPVQETAVECVNAIQDREHPPIRSAYVFGRESGTHSRAYFEALDFFAHLHRYGYDPVARAQREVAYARTQEDLDVLGIDWTWLRESWYDGEVPDDG